MLPGPGGSITQIVVDIRGGDRAQVSPLWVRYFDRLTRHAARHLPLPLQTADEEMALSTIDAFCDGVACGKFDHIGNPEVLWATLARIIERKVSRRIGRWKRGPVLFTDLGPRTSSHGDSTSFIASVEPTEEYSEAVRVELDELIERLPNPLWRQAVQLVMEGYSASEIATKLGRTSQMVHVWFRTIRATWEEEPER